MTSTQPGWEFLRRLSNSLSLSVTCRDFSDDELRHLLEGIVTENSESRGYSELDWLYRTLATSDEMVPTALVASLNGTAVGAAIVLESPERVLICSLHVQNQARGVGVGSSIVHAVRGVAGDRHLSAFALPGDRSTKNLYEQLGMPAKVILAGS